MAPANPANPETPANPENPAPPALDPRAGLLAYAFFLFNL